MDGITEDERWALDEILDYVANDLSVNEDEELERMLDLVISLANKIDVK